jgi:hypothetical protein
LLVEFLVEELDHVDDVGVLVGPGVAGSASCAGRP